MGEEGWPHRRSTSKAADSLAFGESFPNELSSVTRRADFQGQVSATTQRPSADPPHLGSRGCGVAVLETFMTLVAISSDPGATCLSAASPNVSWPGAFSPAAHPLCCRGGPSCSTRPHDTELLRLDSLPPHVPPTQAASHPWISGPPPPHMLMTSLELSPKFWAGRQTCLLDVPARYLHQASNSTLNLTSTPSFPES